MRLIDHIQECRWADGSLTLRSAAGTVTLRPLSDELIQLTVSDLSSFRPLPTGAIAKTDWAYPATSFAEEGDRLVLATASVRVEVTLQPLSLAWYRGDSLFARDESFLVGAEKIVVTRHLAEDEAFYGLGEKTGYLNKRGKRLEMWATDQAVGINTDPLYQSIPFFVALRDGQAHGLFVDCGARSFFDLGSRDPAASYSIEVHSRVYDAYVFASASVPAVVERYTELTGRMELPALWTLGYHQCRYSYYPEAQVREVAALLREKELPCDAIWLDIHYMDGYRVFTWDPARFPDPAALVADLGADGFKVVNIVDPAVKVDPGYAVYASGLAGDHFAKEPSGEVHVGEVWPGKAVYPDFFKASTRAWWGELHRSAYIDVGVAGIWNDMNEPSSFVLNEHGEKTLPYDVLHGEDGRQAPHSQVHNLYALHMTMATHAAFKEMRPEQRPFILSRSGFAGIQRYAAVWGGDDFSWWESLQAQIPLLLSMSVSGIPFVGTDVGGFIEDSNGELLARWLQFGAFSPFFRMHSAVDTREQNPWSFGAAIKEIARKYINLRYQLLPYWYTVFEEAAASGLPVIRPLVFHYQDDPLVRSISDQYLVGSSLLVAPVYQPGASHRMVYLPAGEWFDFWTGARFTGGQHIVAAAPLDVLPLYVRAGGVLPMGPIMPYTGAVKATTLTLLVYAGSGTFSLYEDAGDGYGASARTAVAVTPSSVTVSTPIGEYVPERERIELILYGFAGSDSGSGSSSGGTVTVKLDGQPVSATRTDCGGLRLLVEQVGGFTIGI